MSTALKTSPDNGQYATSGLIVIYFPHFYTGEVHIILGSMVMETAESPTDAVADAVKYLDAAVKCGKNVELVPIDSIHHTEGQPLHQWLNANVENALASTSTSSERDHLSSKET